MKKTTGSFIQNEWIFLLVFFCIFILVRTINFSHFFSFVYDQANFSTTALEIFRERRVQLIGPSISINYGGREIFQGGVIYYFFLLFLLLGGFDPKLSTYIFMLASGIMLIPLYFGCKRLLGVHGARVMTMLYALVPTYIQATISLWNPHFQFALTPFLIYALGFYHTTKSRFALFLLSTLAGFLLQFHYQYTVIIFALFVYYVFIVRLAFRDLLLFAFGLALGFSPMILFEVRNGFYNLRTIILFTSHIHELLGKGSAVTMNTHYLLSISILTLLLVAFAFRNRINTLTVAITFTVLTVWSSATFIIYPYENNVVSNWSYDDELKVYSIIRDTKVTNFNISTFYNAKATSQKYFLKRDHVIGNFEDYKSNDYLFVIYYKNENFLQNRAYEMSTFKPSKVIQRWPINEAYELILSQRI